MPHFALVHFPIALLATAGFLLVLSLAAGWRGARHASVAMFVAGAAMSIPTVVSGLFLAADHASHHSDVLANHRILGVATAVTAGFGVAMHWLRRRVRNADLMRDVMVLVAAALAVGTGYLGGEMGHGGGQAEGGGHGHDSPAAAHDIPTADGHHAPSASPSGLPHPANATEEVSASVPAATPDTAASASTPRSPRTDKPSSHEGDGHDHAH